MMNFIKSWSVDWNCTNNVLALNVFGKATWIFISSIYKSDWNSLYTNDKKTTFRQEVLSKFTSRNISVKHCQTAKNLKINK